MVEISRVFRENNIEIPKLNYSPSQTAKIKSNIVKTETELKEIPMIIRIYMDERALPFSSREYMMLGSKTYSSVIAKFLLIVRTGKKSKSSKAEDMIILSTPTLHTHRQTLRIENIKDENTKILSDLSIHTHTKYQAYK